VVTESLFKPVYYLTFNMQYSGTGNTCTVLGVNIELPCMVVSTFYSEYSSVCLLSLIDYYYYDSLVMYMIA